MSARAGINENTRPETDLLKASKLKMQLALLKAPMLFFEWWFY